MLRSILGGFPFLLPAVSGLLTMLLMQLLKRGMAALDRAPALVKQGVVLALAACLVLAGNALGVAIDPTLAQEPTNAMLESLIAAALAHIIHTGERTDRAMRLRERGAETSVNDVFRLP